MIKVTCLNCGKSFAARDEYAGRKAKCKQCGEAIRIPPLDPQPEAESAQTPAALPRVGFIMGFVGLAIPVIDLAAIVVSAIALGSHDETLHPPEDRKRAMIGIGLGFGGMVIKGCVLGGALIAMSLSNVKIAPPPATAATQAPTPPPEAAPPPAQPVAPPLQKPVTNTVYYYDLGTDQLFVAPPADVTPIDAPSGKDNGVRAYVFACGDCSGQTFIGWLERTAPAARKMRDNNSAVSVDDIIDAYTAQIERSDDRGKTWQSQHAIHYMQWQLQQRKQMCPGSIATECRP